MDTEILKIVGQVAGIGGLALGVCLLLFRDVIRKNIFPNLNRQQGYRLLLLIVVLTWTIALAGLGAWVYVRTLEKNQVGQTENQLSGVVLDSQGKAIPNVDVSVLGASMRDQTTSSGSFLLKLRVNEGTTVKLQAYKQGYKPWNDNVVVPNTGLQIPLVIEDQPSPPANIDTNISRTSVNSKKRSNKNNNSASKPPVITDQK